MKINIRTLRLLALLYLKNNSPLNEKGFSFFLLTFRELQKNDLELMFLCADDYVGKGLLSENVKKDLSFLNWIYDKTKMTDEFLSKVIDSIPIRQRWLKFINLELQDYAFEDINSKTATYLLSKFEEGSLGYYRLLYLLIYISGADLFISLFLIKKEKVELNEKINSGLVTAEDLGIDPDSFGKGDMKDLDIQKFTEDRLKAQEKTLKQGRKTMSHEDLHAVVDPNNSIE